MQAKVLLLMRLLTISNRAIVFMAGCDNQVDSGQVQPFCAVVQQESSKCWPNIRFISLNEDNSTAIKGFEDIQLAGHSPLVIDFRSEQESERVKLPQVIETSGKSTVVVFRQSCPIDFPQNMSYSTVTLCVAKGSGPSGEKWDSYLDGRPILWKKLRGVEESNSTHCDLGLDPSDDDDVEMVRITRILRGSIICRLFCKSDALPKASSLNLLRYNAKCMDCQPEIALLDSDETTRNQDSVDPWTEVIRAWRISGHDVVWIATLVVSLIYFHLKGVVRWKLAILYSLMALFVFNHMIYSHEHLMSPQMSADLRSLTMMAMIALQHTSPLFLRLNKNSSREFDRQTKCMALMMLIVMAACMASYLLVPRYYTSITIIELGILTFIRWRLRGYNNCKEFTWSSLVLLVVLYIDHSNTIFMDMDVKLILIILNVFAVWRYQCQVIASRETPSQPEGRFEVSV